MNERTKAALEESIEKWRQIERGEMWCEGAHNCALCQEFYLNECRGCPVRESTGHNYCVGTPYRDWTDEWDARNPDGLGPEIADTPRLREIARAERKFLESLREKK